MSPTQEHTPWHTRWKEGRIGFHCDKPNEHLKNYVHLLQKGSILLPLCGKSGDISWLEKQGFEVFGIELVKPAIEAFFAEHKRTPQKQEKETFSIYQDGNISLYHSDFFALNRQTLGTFDALYDRAALVALEPHIRNRYVQHCLNLLKPKGRLLLITYDIPLPETQGPPFPVRSPSVSKLYAKASSVQLLKEYTYDQQTEPKLKERGLSWSKEAIWLIQK